MPFSRYPSGSCPCQVSLPFELRHFPAGSLSPLSRIEFVSYRLVVLLRLLPTPPHDDAVAVEYGPENVCPVGTFTLLFKCAYERTRRTLRGPIRSPHGSGSCTSLSRDIPDIPLSSRVIGVLLASCLCNRLQGVAKSSGCRKVPRSPSGFSSSTWIGWALANAS